MAEIKKRLQPEYIDIMLTYALWTNRVLHVITNFLKTCVHIRRSM